MDRGRATAPGQEHGDRRFEVSQIEKAVGRILSGGTVHTPVYDPVNRSRVAERAERGVALGRGVLIVDGVVSLLSESLRTSAALCIYVDVPHTVRRQRLSNFYLRTKGVDALTTTTLLAARELEEVPTVRASAASAHLLYTGLDDVP